MTIVDKYIESVEFDFKFSNWEHLNDSEKIELCRNYLQSVKASESNSNSNSITDTISVTSIKLAKLISHFGLDISTSSDMNVIKQIVIDDIASELYNQFDNIFTVDKEVNIANLQNLIKITAYFVPQSQHKFLTKIDPMFIIENKKIVKNGESDDK